MRTAILLMLSATLTITWSARVRAEMYGYPEKRQSAKQQRRDKRECQEWATRQTGVDPSKTPAARPKLGGAAGGAAMGAARGAAEGEAALRRPQ